MTWVVSLGTFQDSCGWWGLLKGCSKRDLNQRQNAFLTIRDLVWNNNALLFLVSFYRSISGFNAGWDKETRHFVKVLKRPVSSVRVLMLSRWYSPFKRGYLVEILTLLSRLSHSNLRINEVYREKERKYSCTLHEHQAYEKIPRDVRMVFCNFKCFSHMKCNWKMPLLFHCVCH